MGAVGPAALRRSGEREMVAVLYQERCRRRIPMTERFKSFTYKDLIKRDP